MKPPTLKTEPPPSTQLRKAVSGGSPKIIFHVGWMVVACSFSTLQLPAQVAKPSPNYDEAKVPRYVLPDPLTMLDGTKVTDAAAWRQKRRPEILRLFEEHVYGRSPKFSGRIEFEVTSLDVRALGGKATRKEVRVFLTGKHDVTAYDWDQYLNFADRHFRR